MKFTPRRRSTRTCVDLATLSDCPRAIKAHKSCGGSIAEAVAKRIPRDEQCKQAAQGMCSAKQTAYGEQHKTEISRRTAHGEQRKQMACTVSSTNRQTRTGLLATMLL